MDRRTFIGSSVLGSLSIAAPGLGASHSKFIGKDVLKQDLDGLPYHPLVFHLDLAILAYQLYAQTLVWPFDPYYEDLDNPHGERSEFIKRLRGRMRSKDSPFRKYRGPGALGEFDDNASHDPILYQYSRLHPSSSTLSNHQGTWIEHLAPEAITKPIRDVYVCYRKTGQPAGNVVVDPIARGTTAGARDLLLAFEGGTGDKGEGGQPASQSLMGFVLARHSPGPSDSYDIHIAFRGSQSGSLARAFKQAMSDHHAAGNPDWITDMGTDLVGNGEGGEAVTLVGEVNRGFARAMTSILPQVFAAMNEVSALQSGRVPDRIFVTGHSLGGALAQHFVSAVLMGGSYGPIGTGAAMPPALRKWPWKQIKLTTFGAPRSGNEAWAKALTSTGLKSDFFSTRVDPIDRRALALSDPRIITRMTDHEAVGYRVLISSDPITTGKVVDGKHVGKTIYLDNPGLIPDPPNPTSHEPHKIRDLMVAALGDNRIPPTSWRYHEMSEFNPQRDKDKRGSRAEYKKLADALLGYYRKKGLWFDEEAFKTGFEEFSSLLNR